MEMAERQNKLWLETRIERQVVERNEIMITCTKI